MKITTALFFASSLTSSLALPNAFDSPINPRDLMTGSGDAVNTTLPLPSPLLTPRTELAANWEGDCTHHAVSSSDVQAAVNAMATWCDQGNYVQPGWMHWQWNGNGMAYVCAYGGTVACSGPQIRSVFATLVQRCGNSQGSWYRDGPFSFGTDPKGTCECGGICPTT